VQAWGGKRARLRASGAGEAPGTAPCDQIKGSRPVSKARPLCREMPPLFKNGPSGATALPLFHRNAPLFHEWIAALGGLR